MFNSTFAKGAQRVADLMDGTFGNMVDPTPYITMVNEGAHDRIQFVIGKFEFLWYFGFHLDQKQNQNQSVKNFETKGSLLMRRCSNGKWVHIGDLNTASNEGFERFFDFKLTHPKLGFETLDVKDNRICTATDSDPMEKQNLFYAILKYSALFKRCV